VIPVYNEEKRLSESLVVLHHYLKKIAHFSWKIVVADNGSTDNTPLVAKQLAEKYDNISYLHIPVKGKGHAIRKAFLESSADVVCYTDVDLSSNLRYLKLLLEGIACGFDIAIGSRLMQASRIKRSPVREILSRAYNLLVKILFFSRFSDAQCGLKAMRIEAAKSIIPLIRNNNWFFDTELLLLAEYNQYRIFEVPVEWVEDRRSKVHIVKIVFEYLGNLLRTRFTIHKHKINRGLH
jgi:glycosyltransferase involved in cell wall biosynthesis